MNLAILALAAFAACSSRSATTPVPTPAPQADARASADESTPALACYDNLCGMDSYCSCHDADRSERRCWSQSDDCAVDLGCCIADAKLRRARHRRMLDEDIRGAPRARQGEAVKEQATRSTVYVPRDKRPT